MYNKYFSSYYKVKPNKKKNITNRYNLQKNNLHYGTNFYGFSDTNTSDLQRMNNQYGAMNMLRYRKPQPSVLPISAYTEQN